MNISLSYKLYTENLPSVNDLIFQYVIFYFIEAREFF